MTGAYLLSVLKILAFEKHQYLIVLTVDMVYGEQKF